jgi:hypothetical protein
MINSYSALIDEATKASCNYGFHLPGLPPSEQPFEMSRVHAIPLRFDKNKAYCPPSIDSLAMLMSSLNSLVLSILPSIN